MLQEHNAKAIVSEIKVIRGQKTFYSLIDRKRMTRQPKINTVFIYCMAQ